MKKMSMVCVAVVCLVMQGFTSAPQGWLDVYLDSHFPEQEVKRLQEDLKDTAELKNFMRKLLGSHFKSHKEAVQFKRRFDVSDEAMQAVLLDIIRETSAKTGWKPSQLDDAEGIRIADWHLRGAIKWLSACAGVEGKKLLMDIVTDNAKNKDFRSVALHVYMRCADVQETQDTIARFLSDDMGTLTRFYIYHAAIQAYNDAEDISQKREAIVATLTAALAQEKNKDDFTWADKNLAERSKEYADSPQRKAALERMNNPPEKSVP